MADGFTTEECLYLLLALTDERDRTDAIEFFHSCERGETDPRDIPEQSPELDPIPLSDFAKAYLETKKHQRKRERMLAKAKEYQISTYIRQFVARDFQRMIRAEFAAVSPNREPAVVDGELKHVHRELGQVVCVTCGSVHRWDGRKIHTGHFVASRRNSILFDECNVAPQCAHCNEFLHGAPQAYTIWMMEVYGESTIQRLRKQKTESVSFTREQLVDMLIGYRKRLAAAKARIDNPH